MSGSIRPMGKDLYLISLPVPIDGFQDFIGAWLYTGTPCLLVDVGPAACSDHLIRALAQLQVRPDFILLTHIHIDHCGGIGHLAEAFDHAPVVCHRRAVEHLVDPERLWKGSLNTLGDTARAYGPIAAVPVGRILASDRLDVAGVTAIPTPGHAVHHISFAVGPYLFAGEAGGVCFGPDTERPYLRPATPPRFFLETHIESIDRLIAAAPQTICYGHFGCHPDAVAMLGRHRRQLLFWRDFLAQRIGQDGSGDDPSALARLCNALLVEDDRLAGFSDFSPGVQRRERGFLINSVKGFSGYLQALSDNP